MSDPRWQPPAGQSGQLAQRLDDLRLDLRRRQPEQLASLTGAIWENGELSLSFLGRVLPLRWPDLHLVDPDNGREFPPFQQALLLYYLATADGTSLAGRWVTFAELPDGRVYQTAFQASTGEALRTAFGNDLAGYVRAAEKAGGQPAGIGEAGFQFEALPRVPLLAAYWTGEDDLPPSARVLFDASTGHYLPTEACAVLGGLLARRILRFKE